MKRYTVEYSAEASRDLNSIREYFGGRFDAPSADRFTEEILADCESLSVAPVRGARQPGKPENYRFVGAAKGRVTVIFQIGAAVVRILAIHYRGRAH